MVGCNEAGAITGMERTTAAIGLELPERLRVPLPEPDQPEKKPLRIPPWARLLKKPADGNGLRASPALDLLLFLRRDAPQSRSNFPHGGRPTQWTARRRAY